MSLPDMPHQLANELENGEIAHLDEKQQLATSPTFHASPISYSGTATTIAPSFYSPKHAIRKIRTWPRRARHVTSRSDSPDVRIQRSNTIIRKLEDHPEGYPKVAAFLDSDECFMIYRRLGFLHARLLLYKQDELKELEEELRQMDLRDSQDQKTSKMLKSRRKDDLRKDLVERESRKSLLGRNEKKTLEYGQLLTQAQQLVAMNRPAPRDHLSVQTFMVNGKPLLQADSGFINEKEDLITLRPGRENAWLDAFVERVLKHCHCKPIQYIFCSKETRAKTDDPNIRYYTKERVNLFVTLIVTAIILFLLVLPIYALFQISVTQNQQSASTTSIGILLCFTLVFSAALSLFTKARRHEILAAAAGYCAVLVVFVSNIGANINGGNNINGANNNNGGNNNNSENNNPLVGSH